MLTLFLGCLFPGIRYLRSLDRCLIAKRTTGDYCTSDCISNMFIVLHQFFPRSKKSITNIASFSKLKSNSLSLNVSLVEEKYDKYTRFQEITTQFYFIECVLRGKEVWQIYQVSQNYNPIDASSLWLMTSSKKAHLFGGRTFFPPGAHLCNWTLAISSEMYLL